MKNRLLILVSTIFLFSLVSAGLVSAWSYDSDYSYGQAYAYTKIVGDYPTCDGQSYGSYCVGNYVVDVSFIGDKFYMGYSYLSWTPTSNSNGYTGIPSASPGKKILPTKNGHPQAYILCGWDRDDASNGDWAWTSRCGGYLYDIFSELTIVECYQDSDCESNQYCEKTGSTTDQDWSCELKICDAGEERCFGSNLQICENNDWVDKGVVLNKCDVECKTESDCPVDETSEKFCSGNDIMETQTDNFCLNYKCSSNSQDILVETCDYKCQDIEGSGAICIEKVCDAGEKMCSEDGNVLLCQDNQWIADEECQYGCEDGECKSFYTTKSFIWIIVGSIAVLILLITITIRRRKK